MTQPTHSPLELVLADYQGDKRFYALIVQMVETHAAKNADYAGDSDPLANFRECQRFGIKMADGIMVRISDKWSRICTLTKRRRESGEGPRVKDESLRDTKLDMAVYLLLSIIADEEGYGT